MVRFALVVSLIAGSALASSPLQRERDVGFTVDPSFQDSGGVQYFYQLVERDEAKTSELVARLLPLDVHDRWIALSEPTNVVILRFVYTVDKDASFFTEARALDVDYINAVAKEMEVSRNPNGSFHIGRTPANTCWLVHYDEARVKAAANQLALKQLVALAGESGLPDSVVFQENVDFARVLGHRTAAASITWTAHFPLAPGRTRVAVLTMSYVYELPPFFLGGSSRVMRESVRGATDLIERLRAY
jgi:hypothetical protein